MAYRNPNLSEAMKTQRFLNRFGAGISMAREESNANGNPDLEFKISANFVTVVIKGKS